MFAMVRNEDNIQQQLIHSKTKLSEYTDEANDLDIKISIIKKEIASNKHILLTRMKEKTTHLLELLKHGLEPRDTGLCWIIIELWKLGLKVNLRDINKKLDQNSRIFLVKKAKLELCISFIKMNI